jgi:hypothetical protein
VPCRLSAIISSDLSNFVLDGIRSLFFYLNK